MSKITKWIFLPLFTLAVGYSAIGIFSFKSMYHSVNKPKADFLVSGDIEARTNFIIFTTYPCGYCKTLAPIIKELKEVRKDIKFTTHPVGFTEGETRRLTEVAIAAGLQGKFQEMHDALMEHPVAQKEGDIVSEDFINETASLYGIDTDELAKDRPSKKVQKIINKANTTLSNAGIQSVPSFMINKQIYIVNDETVPELKDFLDMIAQAEK